MNYKKEILLSCIISIALATAVSAYNADPNDFAVEVINFEAGTGADPDWIDGSAFDDPSNALGRPTIDTTGDNWKIQTSMTVPVVSVYSAFRSFELVTVGNGGELVVKFNHRVADDLNNPYGIDFIIFGNAQQNANSSVGWANGDPEAFTIGSSNLIAEAGVVSVSQDGVTWHTYDPNSGPFADTFAPTLGRVYDPNNADESIGDWNQWWAVPTNPTLPLDPMITSQDLLGLSVAEAAELYGESAGGTGFDLSELGLDWIQYVKIAGNDQVTPEIDSIADVSCCGDYKHPYPIGDVNKDCRVNMADFAMLAEHWFECSWKCQ